MRHNSRTVFACHEYLHKTYAPSRFDLSLLIVENSFSDALKAAGITHEESVLEFLKTLNLKLEVLDTSYPNNLWERNTAKAMMNPDIDIIYGASIGEFCETELAILQGVDKIGDLLRVSRPDLLIKVGTSKNGFPLWAPVDVKSHNPVTDSKSNQVHITTWPEFDPNASQIVEGSLTDNDAFQLAHYVRHLQALGLSEGPAWAGILGRDSTFVEWMNLNAMSLGQGANAEGIMTLYEIAFAEAVGIKERSIAREADSTLPPVTIARRISACGTCEMLKVCRSEMGLIDTLTNFAKSKGVKLLALQIPREVMEMEATRKGQIKFFELSYLETSIQKTKKNGELYCSLEDFVIPNPELVPDEVRNKVNAWSDYVDYWAVDWDFQYDTFMPKWMDYRTKQDRALSLKSGTHSFDKPGKYKIMVKVVDIFGNDTTKILELTVK